jgi:hypothetical protein
MSIAGTASESVASVETTFAEKIGSIDTTTDVESPVSSVARFERAIDAVVGNAGKPVGIALEIVRFTLVPAGTDAPSSESVPLTGPPAMATLAVDPLMVTGTVDCTENALVDGFGLGLVTGRGAGEVEFPELHAATALAMHAKKNHSRNR